MKKLGFVASIATLVFSICFIASCASTSSISSAENAIIAGSADDPFKNTAWDSKGITLLEFGADGKVAFGYNEVKYSVKKDGESYTATFKPVTKMTFTIATKDANEGINDQGALKIKCTKK